ncbi:MAG: NAD(P)/FAD-dependent oxidoreductase [bacterium]|nr:NAD(P)/FAD-dependent oxidoreductase [bacterium]
MAEKYDLIVIGSGCGGAAAAALGAYQGYRTLLLEKNNFIGGRCATHNIRGFKMDHGHIVSLSSEGPHGEVLRLVASEDLIPPFATIENLSHKYSVFGHVWDLPENFWAGSPLLRMWQAFRMTVEVGLKTNDYFALARIFGQVLFMSGKKSHALDRIDIETHISKYTKSEPIHTLFGGIGAVSFGTLPEDTSTGALFRSFGSQSGRDLLAGYPVNGEGIAAIPKSFIRAAKRYGARIRMKTPVKRIKVSKKCVLGVEIEGETILADRVISNAGIRETALQLVGEKHFEASFVDYLKELKYSYGGISLKYALDRPIVDFHQGGKVPSNFTKNMRDAMEGRVPEETSMMLVCSSNIDPSLAPEGKQNLLVIAPAPVVEPGKTKWKPWVDSLKRQVAEFVPGIDEHTLFCKVSTPDVIARESGRTFGDAVGVAQTIDQVGDAAPSAISSIKGLYYVGADIGSEGVATEMATQSAIDLFQNHFKPFGKW